MADLINLGNTRMIFFYISFILFSGFLFTRITKLFRLPNVSGYIIAGVLIGPHALNIIPLDIVNNISVISDIALAFIAFGVGKFFKSETLRKTGKKVFTITFCESLIAGVFVTLAMNFIFEMEWSFSLLLGAIATATAPASTVMTIKEYNAKGEFVDTLLQVVVLDDVVCILVFSIATAILSSINFEKVSFYQIALPIIYNIAAIILGAIFGIILSKLLTEKRSYDNRLILVITILLSICAICSTVNISPLLSCMVFSAVYVNMTNDLNIYNQVDNFTPPIMSMFFIVSGMNLDIHMLSTAGIIGLCYFVIRIIGKYVGAYIGCVVTNTDKKTKNFLGIALIPQAGVAIGLCALAQRMLPYDLANYLSTIILSSSILYELIGPISAKLALIFAGVIDVNEVK